MKSLVVKDSSEFFKTLTVGPFKSIVRKKLHTKEQGKKHATRLMRLMVEKKINMTLGNCTFSEAQENSRKQIYSQYN